VGSACLSLSPPPLCTSFGALSSSFARRNYLLPFPDDFGTPDSSPSEPSRANRWRVVFLWLVLPVRSIFPGCLRTFSLVRFVTPCEGATPLPNREMLAFCPAPPTPLHLFSWTFDFFHVRVFFPPREESLSSPPPGRLDSLSSSLTSFSGLWFACGVLTLDTLPGLPGTYPLFSPFYGAARLFHGPVPTRSFLASCSLFASPGENHGLFDGSGAF